MKQFYLIIFLLILFSQTRGQNPPDYFALAERFYSYQQYNFALENYLKYYPTDSTNAELNLRIGELFLITNINKSKAIVYLTRAKALMGSTNESLQYKIAKAYYYAYDFDKALATASELSLSTKNMNYKVKVGALVEKIISASTLYEDPVNVKFIHLGPNVNNKYANINPFVSQDETKLFFSSRNSKNIYNLYISDFDSINNIWTKPHKLKRLSTFEDDIFAGIQSNAEHLLIHFGESSSFSNLNISTYSSNGYTEPLDIGSFVSSDKKEEGAFLTNTGDTLYFSSRRDGGYGGLDLYMSIKLPDGKWGIPINLGEKINSSKDENYPFLTPDGKTLYYSSTGFNSMGGYDLFYSNKDSTGNWKYPTNLGYPVNDIYDNKTICFAQNMRYGYSAYVRPEGEGDYDLYKIIFKKRESDFIVFSGIIFYTDNKNKIPIHQKSLDITVNLYDRNTDELVGTFAVNPRNSKITIAVQPGEYKLQISGDVYQTHNEKIIVEDKDYKNKIVHKNFVLKLSK